MLSYHLRIRYRGTVHSRFDLGLSYRVDAVCDGDDESLFVVDCMVDERTMLSAMNKAKDELQRKLSGIQFVQVDLCERIYPPLKGSVIKDTT